MKPTSIAFMAAVLLVGGVCRAFALAGDLDRPSLSLPDSIAAGLRERIMQVLNERPPEFRGGRFVNARTTLRYAGDAPSLNRFLAGFAACPDLRLEIMFGNDAEEVAWTVEHDGGAAPNRFAIRINLDGKSLRLEQVRIPEIRTPSLPSVPAQNPPPPASDPTGPGAPGQRGFGPVVERVVPFGVPCAAKYFQFHTGNVFEIGEGPGDTSDHAEEWRRIEASGGVDGLAIGGEAGLQFAGEGCLFTQEGSPDWETLTAEATMKQLRHATWITGVIEAKRSDLPLTLLFKTARGDCGILQIRGITNDPRGSHGLGMTIRYKLVSPARD